MEEDKPDGTTAMERLCRELMENVNSYSWCREHIPSIIEGIDDWDMWNYEEAITAVRSDIERRIEDARAEDDCADSYAAAALKALTGMHRGHAMCTRGEVDEMVAVAEGWKAEADELDALCRVLNAESADEAATAARALAEEHYELKELREAGRVMPEGLSWPRYADGEPVRAGDEMRGTGRSRHLFRVVGVAPGDGRTAVVCEDMDEGGELCYVDPDMLTRERPDSWGRLREDALKTFYAYWGCEGMLCTLCPAKIGDERPCDHYGTGTSCTDAIRLDLVARAERLAGVQGE